MQAALDGKEIERFVGNTYDNGYGWVVLDNAKEVDYDWTNQDYRIKSYPIELMIDVYETIQPAVYQVASDENRVRFSGVTRTIKVREVTDE